MNELKNYFNAQFHKIDNGVAHKTFSPVNLENKLWETAFNVDHAKACIESSLKGFKAMKSLSIERRCELLNNYKEAVLKKSEQIARALSDEVGKPLWEAMTEAKALAAKVDVTINASLKRIKNEYHQGIMNDIDGHLIYRPIRPSLVIGPFNFPCHLANGQILSLLIAGNSVIFKPSEKTLRSTQLMMEAFHEAGFPEGAINMVIGGGKIAQEIVSHPKIKGIFFTGSKNVGLKILESTYKNLDKLVALELGGKNTTIVHKDANMDHALAELINSCYLTTGQRCTST